jgi:PPOX class probable F420-dependent enzyme
MVGEGHGKLYAVTGRTTGKLKRIANNPMVEFAPCDRQGNRLGETMQGRARVLSSQEWAAVKDDVRWRVPAPLRFVASLLRDLPKGGGVYLEITPT